MAELNILEAIRTAMDEELERDPNVMVLGEDVGKKGGVFGATEGLFAKYGEKRVLDTPLTEGMIAGAAAGAAIYGLRPIAEMQFADFVYPAFNQIVSEISRMRYRSNGAFGLPMVIRMPYGGGVHGALYHSQSNEAYFTSTVGLKVVAPGTPADAKGLLKAAVRDPDPVMFFEHKKTYRLFKAEVPDGDHVVPIGSAEVARSGKDLSIFCYGYMRTCALEAAEMLARDDGVEAEVVDLRTLRPLDTATVAASVERTGKALVVHEANRFGGFGAEVAAWIAQECFEQLDGPVTRLAGPEVPGVPFHHVLEDWFMLDAQRLSTRPARWPRTEPMPSATQLLATQMDEAYRFVHDRVQGLTDEEFFWEPVPDSWTVRQGRGRPLVGGLRRSAIPIHRRSPPSPGAWCTSPSARSCTTSTPSGRPRSPGRRSTRPTPRPLRSPSSSAGSASWSTRLAD